MGSNRDINGNDFDLDMGISIYRNRYMGIYKVEE